MADCDVLKVDWDESCSIHDCVVDSEIVLKNMTCYGLFMPNGVDGLPSPVSCFEIETAIP